MARKTLPFATMLSLLLFCLVRPVVAGPAGAGVHHAFLVDASGRMAHHRERAAELLSSYLKHQVEPGDFVSVYRISTDGRAVEPLVVRQEFRSAEETAWDLTGMISYDGQPSQACQAAQALLDRLCPTGGTADYVMLTVVTNDDLASEQAVGCEKLVADAKAMTGGVGGSVFWVQAEGTPPPGLPEDTILRIGSAHDRVAARWALGSPLLGPAESGSLQLGGAQRRQLIIPVEQQGLRPLRVSVSLAPEASKTLRLRLVADGVARSAGRPGQVLVPAVPKVELPVEWTLPASVYDEKRPPTLDGSLVVQIDGGREAHRSGTVQSVLRTGRRPLAVKKLAPRAHQLGDRTVRRHQLSPSAWKTRFELGQVSLPEGATIPVELGDLALALRWKRGEVRGRWPFDPETAGQFVRARPKNGSMKFGAEFPPYATDAPLLGTIRAALVDEHDWFLPSLTDGKAAAWKMTVVGTAPDDDSWVWIAVALGALLLAVGGFLAFGRKTGSSTARGLILLAALGGMLSALPSPARAGIPRGKRPMEVLILLDTSGSMVGNCRGSCRRCSDEDACPEGWTCKRRRCVRLPDNPPHCRAIWDDVSGRMTDFVATGLPQGSFVHLYGFSGGGNRLRPVWSGTVTPSGIEEVRHAVARTQPEARCTFVYDLAWELLDRHPAPSDKDQVVVVFTDGDDEGSEHSGRQLRERLDRVAQNGTFTWYVFRPADAPLADLCTGEDSGCTVVEEGSWTSLETQVSARAGRPSGSLSLEHTTVSIPLSLDVRGETITPFQLGATFHADGSESEGLLLPKSPVVLRNGDEEAVLELVLRPNLSIPRPEKLTGYIELQKHYGLVTLDAERVPVSLDLKTMEANSTAKLAGPYRGGTQRYAVPVPSRLWDRLAVSQGLSDVKLGIRVLRSKKSRGLPRIDGSADGAALASEGSFAVTLSTEEAPARKVSGLIALELEDENGWFQVSGIRGSAAFAAPTPRVQRQAAPSEGSGTGLWLVLVALAAIVAGFLVFRALRGYPDGSLVALEWATPSGDPARIQPFPRDPLRLKEPKASVNAGRFGGEHESELLLSMDREGGIHLGTRGTEQVQFEGDEEPIRNHAGAARIGELAHGRISNTVPFRYAASGPIRVRTAGGSNSEVSNV